jgi:hypothetical protein
MLRQSVLGRLAGYEDVNDAERLRHDPVMRWIVGGKAAAGCAASASQMGRFETRLLTVSNAGLPQSLHFELSKLCYVLVACNGLGSASTIRN